MATMFKGAVKGFPVEFDLDVLSKENLYKAAGLCVTRKLFEKLTGHGEKSTDEAIQAGIAEFVKDPNGFIAKLGTRGEGAARPKMTPISRKAAAWFSAEFLPALKLGHEKAKAIWAKAGGQSTVFKAKDGATEADKAIVDANAKAKNTLIAAKVAKLTKDGWEPEL